MINDLPALFIHQLILNLSRETSVRDGCDILRDCISLAATSKETRTVFSRPLAAILSPLSPFEHLELAPRVLASDLRVLSRANDLAVSGTKTVLRERLRAALEDRRLVSSGVGPRFCRALRHSCLTKALHARGCVLREDSTVSWAFINGIGGEGMEAVVDCAEEMQFYYTKTNYSRILSRLRRYHQELDEEDEEDGEYATEYRDEETRREQAKRSAVREWLQKRGSNGRIMNMPRTLRPNSH